MIAIIDRLVEWEMITTMSHKPAWRAVGWRQGVQRHRGAAVPGSVYEPVLPFCSSLSLHPAFGFPYVVSEVRGSVVKHAININHHRGRAQTIMCAWVRIEEEQQNNDKKNNSSNNNANNNNKKHHHPQNLVHEYEQHQHRHINLHHRHRH
jgi:hypothetical protein